MSRPSLEVFTELHIVSLARLIYCCFDCDSEKAAEAWRRLHQNGTPTDAFMFLVEHPTFVSLVPDHLTGTATFDEHYDALVGTLPGIPNR